MCNECHDNEFGQITELLANSIQQFRLSLISKLIKVSSMILHKDTLVREIYHIINVFLCLCVYLCVCVCVFVFVCARVCVFV